jgi:hypothetical protein
LLDFRQKKGAENRSFQPFCLNPKDGTQSLRGALPCDEVVRGPWAAHYDLNPGQMPGGHLVAVLVFLNFFVINKVGDIDKHSAGINFAATNVLVNRRKNLVDLDGEGTRLGLPLALPDRFFPQSAQILTANSGRQLDLFHGFTQRTIFDQEFQMHFSLALEFGNAFQETLAIEANRAAQCVIGIKNRAKAKWQNCCALEAFADYMRVLEESFLTEIASGNVFTYQDGKITAGIREYLGICYTFETFYGNGATSANTTLN